MCTRCVSYDIRSCLSAGVGVLGGQWMSIGPPTGTGGMGSPYGPQPQWGPQGPLPQGPPPQGLPQWAQAPQPRSPKPSRFPLPKMVLGAVTAVAVGLVG